MCLIAEISARPLVSLLRSLYVHLNPWSLRLKLFRSLDDQGNPYLPPRTLLIDNKQLESGDTLDKNFRNVAADEIDRFRREIIERTGDRHQVSYAWYCKLVSGDPSSA